MKIAFISYEYPLDTALGGIATYVQQAAKVMRGRNHLVEVFAASPVREGTNEVDGLTVHLIREPNTYDFSCVAGHAFRRRHDEIRFDVLEGPEYNADAAKAVELVPAIPLVVKTHGPTWLGAKLNQEVSWSAWSQDVLMQFRIVLADLRRGRIPQPFQFCPAAWRVAAARDRIEADHARRADVVTTPSSAISRYVAKRWALPADRLRLVPNPYVPCAALTDIPVATRSRVVGFIGRVGLLKGALDLAEAIPQVLSHCPDVRFKFVGAVPNEPGTSISLSDTILNRLGSNRKAVEFTGKVPLNEVPRHLASVDIAVIPSHWETFPNVCLEAMAAGRGIVASSAGGMSEMLAGGEAGLLVPPRQPKRIAAALLHLLQNDTDRMDLGSKARQRVLAEYNASRMGALTEQAYEEAIAHRRALGPRHD